MKKIFINNILSKKRLARGDTIVEVMISMTVLAIVVAAAYATSNRAFNSSLNFQYRDQGVSFGQQQLEFIKEADNSLVPYTANYEASPGTPFCIDPVSKLPVAASSSTCQVDQLHRVAIVYDNATQTFKTTTTWSSSTNQPQQVVLYYKPNDSFAGSPIACRPGDLGCTATVTNPPSISLSATPPTTINIGGSTVLTWSALNIKPGTCRASSSPVTAFPASVDTSASPGSYRFIAVAAGTYNFSISCNDSAGNPVPPGTAFVIVNNPAPTATTGSASSVTYSSATLNGTVNPNGLPTTYVFNYGTSASYGFTTPAGSAGSGSSGVPASAAIAGLSPSTVYHFRICATNAAGTVCGSDVTFPTNPLPPPPLQVYFCDDINYWGTCEGPFGAGDYAWVPDYGIPNDASSSMFFNTSTTANVYIMWDVNFGGICHVMNSNTPDFRYTDPRGSWNDVMSSFIIGTLDVSGPSCV
jgi:Tfp pilus assembly protein PilV